MWVLQRRGKLLTGAARGEQWSSRMASNQSGDHDQTMGNEPQDVIRQVLAGLDQGDANQVMDAYAADAVGIDEVSRGWLRGHDQVAAYTAALLSELSSCTSELSEVHETVIGEVAVVTGILQQEYTLGGEAQSVRMPATFVLRRDGGSWRVLLFHALPIPD